LSMSMLLVLVCTASAATHNRLRADHHHLRTGHGRVTPHLQSDEVYHDDFVHDDTAHPEQAVKVNIRDSEQRLKDAEEELAALKSRYEAASKAKNAALQAFEEHQDELDNTKKMVDKYTKAMSSLPDNEKGLKESEETLKTAEDSVNKTDQAATAAAETVKQAQEDLHDRIMALVDAKDNRSTAEDAVSSWETKVADAVKANTTLAEWTQKLNTTTEHHKALAIKVNETSAEYNKVHGDWRIVEEKLDEAQKIFDIDRQQYEEYIGPYPPSDKPKENLWWNALKDGKWHSDWPHFFF